MNQMNPNASRQHSLTARFGLLLILAGVVSAVAFFFLQTAGSTLLTRYLDNAQFQETYIEEKVQDFQRYVTSQTLSVQDTYALTQWVQKNPLLFMEIYRDNILLYTSFAPEGTIEAVTQTEPPYYYWVSYYPVTFSDGTADVVIYADATYRWFTCLTVTNLILSFLLFLSVFIAGIRNLVRYICHLSNQIQAMEGGDLDQPILVKGRHELSRLAQGLDSMRQSFREQRQREADLYRANQAMITQMSHDLRTPLTTLQIYTDILRYRKMDSPDQTEAYLNRIEAKIAQIKQLSENIFEYSLVSSQQPIRLDAPRPLREIFRDPLSEATAYLQQQGFSVTGPEDWTDQALSVYPQYVKRIIDNLVSNIMKYADPDAPVELALTQAPDQVSLTFSNTIRPDRASQDSSQIGLSNIRSMMAKMNGELQVETTPTRFQAILRFPAFPLSWTAKK